MVLKCKALWCSYNESYVCTRQNGSLNCDEPERCIGFSEAFAPDSVYMDGAEQVSVLEEAADRDIPLIVHDPQCPRVVYKIVRRAAWKGKLRAFVRISEWDERNTVFLPGIDGTIILQNKNQLDIFRDS